MLSGPFLGLRPTGTRRFCSSAELRDAHFCRLSNNRKVGLMNPHTQRLIGRVVAVCRAYDGTRTTAGCVQGWADATANALDSSADTRIAQALQELVNGLELAFYFLPEDDQPSAIKKLISDFLATIEQLGWSELSEPED